jgi:putative ABC transport system permease protein
VIAVFSGALALIIVQLSLPWFNQLVDESLTIPFGDVTFWLYAIGFILFTGFLAGSYPAFHLSSFKILTALKGVNKSSGSFFQPRKVLVVVQFTFAIILITCTFIIYQQIRFGQNRDAGYDVENLVYVYMQGDIKKNYEHIRRELLNSHAATSVMRTNSPITFVWNWETGYTWEGKDPNKSEGIIRQYTESDFTKTMGLRLVEGRDIDARTYTSDSSAVLLNESAVKMMGFKQPIGQTIQNREGEWHVVGVIKDYVIGGPYSPAMPMVVHGPKTMNWFGTVTFRLNPGRPMSENIADATAVFNTYNPDNAFNYHFVDETYSSGMGGEKVMGKLAGLFAGLTIFISCLGLFALAAYTIEGRFKEIGVRKVMGASIVSITTLLSKGFLKLVVISFVIASVIGWWSMEQWLQQYPYRVSIEWWMFAITGLLSVAISLLTVSFQSVKAALSNPVNSLKSE